MVVPKTIKPTVMRHNRQLIGWQKVALMYSVDFTTTRCFVVYRWTSIFFVTSFLMVFLQNHDPNALVCESQTKRFRFSFFVVIHGHNNTVRFDTLRFIRNQHIRAFSAVLYAPPLNFWLSAFVLYFCCFYTSRFILLPDYVGANNAVRHIEEDEIYKLCAICATASLDMRAAAWSADSGLRWIIVADRTAAAIGCS